MDTTFLEMRCREVINICDGRSLGHICDMVFDICSGRVLGFAVPGTKSFFSFFRRCPETFIPYCNICKIGEDVILVDVICEPNRREHRRERDKECKTCRTFSDDGRVQTSSIEPDISNQKSQAVNYEDIQNIKPRDYPNSLREVKSQNYYDSNGSCSSGSRGLDSSEYYYDVDPNFRKKIRDKNINFYDNQK